MPVGSILTDVKIYMGGFNLSGFHNSVQLEYGVEMLDDTVFGTNGTRSNKPGMKTLQFTGGGFWDTTQDAALFARIGAVREVMSWAPLGNAEGDRAFTSFGVNGQYNPLNGEVGGLLPFELNFNSSNAPLVRGVVLALGSKGASGNSSSQNLGLLGATQRAYSALHVTTVNPTSIQVTVESDDATGFPSPTTRITHSLITSAGGVAADWKELAGPVATDTFWRSKWVLVGAGPFTIFHVFGIQ